jgi:hypothetical protein
VAVQVERPWEFMAEGLDFELGMWSLLHYTCPKAPIPMFYWLSIYNPFIWTLNKMWPLNPTAS